jgi:predicted Zn-ribbon and HTH transcriptional regulator
MKMMCRKCGVELTQKNATFQSLLLGRCESCKKEDIREYARRRRLKVKNALESLPKE